jgi:BirA family biotin operon repressor/biotin-[acetyl-CoA-carboxylase] ligase
MKIIRFDQLPSTNQHLLQLINQQDFEEGLCVQADFQTNGRGQQGNYWESESGKNLTFSFVLCPDFLSASNQFILSQLVSVAIKQTLDRYTKGVSVKWPNDIFWNDKKIAGILIENSLIGYHIEHSVIGIGLNVNQEHFLDTTPNPISLKMILGKSLDISILLNDLLESIFAQYTNLIQGGEDSIREKYNDSLYRKDGYYPFRDENGDFIARVACVMDDGKLCLVTDVGENREYYFKEVKWL